MDEIQNAVLTFFDKYSKTKIALGTSINNDLNLIGDDVDLVFDDFCKEFKISLLELPFDKYFLQERMFLYWYWQLFKPEKLKKPPLTVGHLAEVVRVGHWFEPSDG
jgi:hypothetical protein